MAEENPSEFKFKSSETESDSFYHEELKDLRIEKLSQRITLLSILLPCLIAVSLYYGYQTLSGRIGRSDNTGSMEIQRLTKQIDQLSKDFNEKLITFSTTLSTQDKDFGTSITGRLSGINQSIDKLQKDVGTLEQNFKLNFDKSRQNIEKLKGSKADKKSLAVAIEKINASIRPLQTELQKLQAIRKDLSAVSADMVKLEGRWNAKLDAAGAKTDELGKDYQQLEKALAKLSGQAVDKDLLALEVFKIKKIVQRMISEAVSDLNEKLDAIKIRAGGVGEATVPQKQSMKKSSRKTIYGPSGTVPQSSASAGARPKPAETITEKDLLE
jgi:chromosome segregation ATPase